MNPPMDPEILRTLLKPAPEAAPLILGWELFVAGVGGRIVEVEAYTDDDPASHAFGGPRGRNLPMFLEGGHVYVYRSYGVHWCLNLVTGPAGSGQAVLIRALEPLAGLEVMRERRPGVLDHRLLSGPGNLTKGLGLGGDASGTRLGVAVDVRIGQGPQMIASGTRIGITRALERKWRFCSVGSLSISKKPLR
jgi:DNA-3-methyladenine glycosylase